MGHNLTKKMLKPNVLITCSSLLLVPYLYSEANSSNQRHSHLTRNTEFRLWLSEDVRKMVGEDFEIQYPMKGKIDQWSGLAHVTFTIKGSQGEGRVELKALRDGWDWRTEKLLVETREKTITIQ